MTSAKNNKSGEEAVKNQSKRTMKCPILNRALSKSAWQRSFQLPHGNPASHTAPLKSEISNLKFQCSTPSPAISDLICEVSNVPRPPKTPTPATTLRAGWNAFYFDRTPAGKKVS
jgi:hypothetical protein